MSNLSDFHDVNKWHPTRPFPSLNHQDIYASASMFYTQHRPHVAHIYTNVYAPHSTFNDTINNEHTTWHELNEPDQCQLPTTNKLQAEDTQTEDEYYYLPPQNGNYIKFFSKLMYILTLINVRIFAHPFMLVFINVQKC